MKKTVSILLILIVLFSSVCVYASGGSYDYVDYDESSGKMIKKRSTEDVTDLCMGWSELDEQLPSGWYVVKSSYTIGKAPHPPFKFGGMGINGDVHIIICDGATLTVEGGFGIDSKSGKKGRLYIHGQGRGKANLVIKGMAAKGDFLVSGCNYACGQGVELTEFSVCGCNVTITAADGFRGEAPFDVSGKNGYAGIQNTNAHFYYSNIKVYGGNGGDSAQQKSLYGKKK